MILKVLFAIILVTTIYQVYALKCYKYECHGHTCNLFRVKSLGKRFVEICSVKAIGCQYIRGTASNLHNVENPPPPLLERRGCWEDKLGRQITEDKCSFNRNWTEFFPPQDGKKLDLDIRGDECFCFSDLCNGETFPSASGKNFGSYYWLVWLIVLFVLKF